VSLNYASLNVSFNFRFLFAFIAWLSVKWTNFRLLIVYFAS